MKIKHSILREALRVSKLNNTPDRHAEYGNYHHFSFLIWEGKILTWATNKNSGCSHIQFGYTAHSKTHSEFEVLRKRKGWVSLGKCAIINVRLSKNNETKVSAPCMVCKKLLRYNGIKTVYYTITGNTFERLEL